MGLIILKLLHKKNYIKYPPTDNLVFLFVSVIKRIVLVPRKFHKLLEIFLFSYFKNCNNNNNKNGAQKLIVKKRKCFPIVGVLLLC